MEQHHVFFALHEKPLGATTWRFTMNELLLILQVLRDPAWSAIGVLVSILLAKLSKKVNSKSPSSSQKKRHTTTLEPLHCSQTAIQQSSNITLLIQDKDQYQMQIVIIF